ncbi:MAG: preprotein translocase subunit YajC [Anaerolineaceae bacterium]|nr:preprotein translocase subunit YajC [Anaerolineaceae bacterium]
MEEFAAVAALCLLGLGAYWAFFVFPRQRTFIKRQRIVQSLEPGNRVITGGGMVATVVSVDVDAGTTELEISKGVCVTVVSAAVLQRYEDDSA